MKSRTFYAKKNIITGFLNRIIILGLPFIIRTIIIRELGVEYLGLSGLFSAILQVLNMAELGFSSAVVFSLYKPIAEKNTDEICALLSFYRTVYRIIGAVILVVGTFLMPFLPKLIHGSYPADINLYLLYVIYLLNTGISYLAFAYKNVLFVASQRQDVLNNISSVLSISKFIIQIIMLLLMRNYYLYIIWNLVFTIIENLYVAFKTKKDFPDYECRGHLDKKTVHEITVQIKGLAIGQLTKVSRNSFDSIVLSMYCGLIDVAIYSNYYYVLNAVLGILGILTTSINAGVGNSIAVDTVEKNYNDFKKFLYYFGYIGAVCTSCFYFLYQPFMALWAGSELIAPTYVMILFCIYFYLIQMGLVRSVYANAAGVWWELRFPQIAEMISNMILNFVLGYLWGMAGILVATIITMFVFCIIGQTRIFYQVYFKKNYVDYVYLSIKYVIYTIIMIWFVRLIDRFIIVRSWLYFFIEAFLVLILSSVVYMVVSMSDKSNREYLMDFIRRVRGV